MKRKTTYLAYLNNIGYIVSCMNIFSQRKGIKPIKTAIQIESMDNELRNGLWNALIIYYWNYLNQQGTIGSYISLHKNYKLLFTRLWVDYFKAPLDKLDDYWPIVYKTIRDYYFKCAWNEVYDFIEVIVKLYPDESTNTKFITSCNLILEKEKSAYRFVAGIITNYTSQEEIQTIEDAMATPFKSVNSHLHQALQLYSDRDSPDYRNSIKESISAVEALCKNITGKDGTLGQLIKETNIKPALKKSISSLYGYTSSEDGIRHGMLEDSTLDSNDAKFMLVFCSSFVNYLIAKT